LTSYLLDTNHSSRLFRREPKVVATFTGRASEDIVLCMPSVAELWFMVHNSRRVQQNRADMIRFISNFPLLDLTPNAAEEFGVIKSELRRLGKPIPDVDIQIAAVARTAGRTLLTDDAHFASVPNLRLENWLRT
jgi:tRNA(fMet)-specific endonuclease VapC